MQGLNKNTKRDEDARDALLKYADQAKNAPEWVAPAYKQSQPKEVFSKQDIKKVGMKFLEDSWKKKCAHCGLKFCTCRK